MNVEVCSRQQAVGARCDQPWAVISIRNPGMTPVEFDCPNLKGVLYLEFDDIDRIKDNLVPFNLSDAHKVWDFIQARQTEGVNQLLVHCLMGLSRSPGIAAAVDKVLKGDDMKWFNDKSPQGKVPNRRVYQCMLHVANERGLI